MRGLKFAGVFFALGLICGLTAQLVPSNSVSADGRGGGGISGGISGGGGIPDNCPADIAPSGSGNNIVDVDDLLAVINAWGACADPNNCPADIAPPGRGDDTVNVDDLLAVINAWGPCP